MIVLALWRRGLLRRLDRALLSSQTAVSQNRAMLDAGLASLGLGVPPGAAATNPDVLGTPRLGG